MKHALVLNGNILAHRDFSSGEAPTLSENKGKWLPVVISDSSPDITVKTRTVTIEANRVVEEFTPDYSGMRAKMKARVKTDAGQVILERYPDWKQRNMNALATELTEIKTGRALTTDENTVLDSLKAAWAWVKSVRAESDAIEADIDALANADLPGFRWGNRWPS